jgi:Putative adhesin
VRYEFATPEPPRLQVSVSDGRVEIETGPRADTVVTVEGRDVEELGVEQRGREIVVERGKRFGRGGGSYDVRILAPEGADAELALVSADVRGTGRFGEVRVRNASGDVLLDSVRGRLDLSSVSGDVVVQAATRGGAIRTASGDVVVRVAGERLGLITASGDLVIDAIAEGALDLKSASGDMRIGIAAGSRLHVDARSLSGETTSDLEILGVETTTEGPLVELRATSMSGNIRIVRA